jgi:hypothetical protein
MVIINKGKAVIEGGVLELLSSGLLKVTITVDNFNLLNKSLENSNFKDSLLSAEGNRFVLEIHADMAPSLHAFIIESGAGLISSVPVRSLEEYFISLTA